MWGNAVNGIINIITKRAGDTQGALVLGGGGTEERGFGGARYGGRIGNGADYRIFAKYFNRDQLVDAQGMGTDDGWAVVRGGGRLDWEEEGGAMLTVQGDLFSSAIDQVFTFPLLVPLYQRTVVDDTEFSGGDLVGRYQKSDLALQVYYDWTDRREYHVAEKRRTFDVDLQYRLVWGRQEIVWGGGYRRSADEATNSDVLQFDPSGRTVERFNLFVQDDVAIIKKKVRLIAGSKFEHNDFTGFEVQPNLRLLWTPGQRQTLWGALSRAVRIPARIDDDLTLLGQVTPPDSNVLLRPAAAYVLGDPGVESEKMHAAELGCRLQPTDIFFVDLVLYNTYDGVTVAPVGPATVVDSVAVPYLYVPLGVSNELDGRAFGFEVVAEYRPVERWQLYAAYSYLNMGGGFDDVDPNRVTLAQAGFNPAHQVMLHARFDPAERWQIDGQVRYVGELADFAVDAYVELDLRLAHRVGKNLEVYLVGQNLLQDHHAEFAPQFIQTPRAEVERGVYSGFTWGF